ncbi:MAG: hypothetical protein IK152_01555 [Lachnospiraceae bacterium]|nr:hypothetical protein [Lachnospiraceae bacterium]
MKKYRPAIFALILVLFGVGLFFYVTRKPSTEEGNTTVSDLGKIVERNYERNYPATPREVAADYSDIVLYLYNKDCSDSDIEKLANTARKLMDDELLTQNPIKSHIAGMKAEKASFKKDNEEIISYTLPAISEVKYFEFENAECAGVKVSYFIKKTDSTFSKTFQQFLFRKDAKGRWKIYGYKKVDS